MSILLKLVGAMYLSLLVAAGMLVQAAFETDWLGGVMSSLGAFALCLTYSSALFGD